MTLAIFKYGLPLILGYTLFVGVSGRLNPFTPPQYRQERASWYLGIWVGMSISSVLVAGLHLALGMPRSYAYSLLGPSLSLLVCLIAPALILYGLHRYQATRSGPTQLDARFDWSISDDDSQADTCAVGEYATDNPDDTTTETHEYELTAPSTVSPAYLDAVQIDQMSHEMHRDAVNDSDRLEQIATNIDDQLGTRADNATDSTLAREIALREETEKHLRITRKALSVLESDTRHHSIDKANALIALEEKLAQSIDSAAELEAVAEQEKVKRIEAEECIVDLKLKMVNAKQEIRRGAAARAKALSTANKSIAFARQAVQIRSRLETQLTEAQTTLASRQKTMSSLAHALEKEKRRNQQEIAKAARQLVLNEKQLNAKRSLEEVARSVENKLTTRLVKKVARARPLSPDLNQGNIK
ncbi:MAG: hypothetical protein AB8B97_09360 [Granulosicoccus sp.]